MIVYLSTIGLGRQTVRSVSQPLHIHTLFITSGGRIPWCCPLRGGGGGGGALRVLSNWRHALLRLPR